MKTTFHMDSSWKCFFPLVIIFPLILQLISAASDTINATQSIRDGETLVSSGGRFELGFFSPGNSSNRYLGLWFKNLTVTTIVWVANRGVPLTNTRGILRVIEPGLLVLLNDTNGIVWSSNTSRAVQNPMAQLLDDGNIVVRDVDDESPENFLWQSFDHPTDTYLPGMKFGRNLVTGLETYYLSWRSSADPAPGEISFHLDPTGYPQILLKKGGDVVYRIGPWNGIRFSGTPNSREDPTYRLSFVMNETEVTYREDTIDKSVVSRFTVNPNGVAQRLTWVDRTQGWVTYMNMPADICDTYKLCGAYGRCNIANSPSCGCLERFVPKDPQAWVGADWSNGCIRRANLSCQGDVFLRYSGIKLPDSRNSRYNTSMTLDECRTHCSRNCSCTAYTQLNISSGSGCLFWLGDLVDIRSLSPDGQDIYIRMASSESDSNLTIFSVAVQYSHHNKDSELPLFDLSVITKATNNFSMNNKLGEGGFGPVYKGILEEGQEIAVKTLSKDSMQGLDEFKNEVIFIAKLQHRNLVRLLGCCIQEEETMLIYEYMANKSLDVMLFDQTRSKLLDWQTRFNIINGIARGLLYLHQDSRLRIIHRDLKASNILLDSDMNPKISDFGMARSFGGNETEAKTRRVVGTYGYMSPEYAVDGLFSVKSDVFSFGVLVLEIAWTLYKEGRSLELVDSSLGDSFYFHEVVRSIHVGLLCVQQNPEDRPTMSSVVLMLGNEGVFPQAKQPGFFTERDVLAAQSATSTHTVSSANEVTITMPEPR
ncbi:G-type lectin S-receptor-like serine/threonine-protein kinase [Sesamum angolense]|uniref:Receptor-like serine/threonine-protein kinase n=1 Tax=Sesamum angolense TaxID=2727404 RepID=A0AAE1W5I1_9LAMI|nr:G-type lectin S-receptor-like serine/threonine-protein kinase [Sesamum angolense]